MFKIVLGGVHLVSAELMTNNAYAKNTRDNFLYAARKPRDLLQVVDFTSLLQIVNKLWQVCENQTYCTLIFANLLQLVDLLASSLWIKSVDNQPTTDLMTARQQARSRLPATCTFLPVYLPMVVV